MTKRQKKLPAWKTSFDEAAKGDGSYLWTVEEDEQIPLTLDLTTLIKEEEDKTDGGMHQYPWLSVEMNTPEMDSEKMEREEIPFWAKKAFVKFIDDNMDLVDGEGILDVWFTRSKGEKGNEGSFHEQD